MADDQFLTTEEVLELLQVNLRTVYRLIKAGRIPAVRVGRQWRFRRKDIDRWIDENRNGRDTAHRRRILIVDDEPAVRELLAKALAQQDYEVETAPDGPSALERLRVCEFDLLITDLKMPGMDGLTVIREGRRYLNGLPVIIITGYSTEASAIEAVNMGVSGYLTKPFRLAKVVASAARALNEPLPSLGA